VPRYLIEVPHDDELAACVKALRAIDELGSHFLTRVDWGCNDGTHACWLVMELGSREEALQIIPVEFRKDARIVELNKFTRDQLVSMIAELRD